jgi:hypothetical protein
LVESAKLRYTLANQERGDHIKRGKTYVKKTTRETEENIAPRSLSFSSVFPVNDAKEVLYQPLGLILLSDALE